MNFRSIFQCMANYGAMNAQKRKKAEQIYTSNDQVVKTFNKLYLDEKSADIYFTIVLNNKCIKIPAHKAILAAASPAFDEMFYGDMIEEGDIRISDVAEVEFKEFLQYFYRRELLLTLENIAKVMSLANQYQIPEFLNVCGRFLIQNLPINKICFGYQLAVDFGDRMSADLREFCEKEISANSGEVFQSQTFLNCSRELLENILRIGNFSCGALQVFNACMDWATQTSNRRDIDSKKIENLKSCLGRCLYLIQFDLMNPPQIAQCLAKYKGLFDQNELEEIIRYYSHIFLLHLPVFIQLSFFVSLIVSIMGGNFNDLRIFHLNAVGKCRKSSVLECCRVQIESTGFENRPSRLLNPFESVSFNVSKMIVLYEIEVAAEQITYINPLAKLFTAISISNTNGNMISQYSIEICQNEASSRIKLPEAITCTPNVDYNIKFFFRSPNGWVLNKRCKSEVDIEPDTRIVFQREQDDLSIITHLYFKKSRIAFPN